MWVYECNYVLGVLLIVRWWSVSYSFACQASNMPLQALTWCYDVVSSQDYASQNQDIRKGEEKGNNITKEKRLDEA